ncbi:MAG: alpha/beta fold hydrolase [Luteibaculaceae bacterium]
MSYLHYDFTEKPNSTSTLVLLHGFMEDLSVWEEITPLLYGNHLKVDLPGHGKSKSLAMPHTMENFANELNRLLDHLSITGPIHLIGHSMGGYVSLAFADRYPKQVKSIFLVNSTALADTPEKQNMREKAAQMVLEAKQPVVNMAVRNLFNPDTVSTSEQVFNHLYKIAMAMDANAISRTQLGMRVRKDYSNFSLNQAIPLHYIIGKKDPLIPFESYWHQMQNNHGSALVLADGGHLAFYEAPALVAGFINNLLEP